MPWLLSFPSWWDCVTRESLVCGATTYVTCCRGGLGVSLPGIASPCGLSSPTFSVMFLQVFASWTRRPQWKHRPNNHLYWNATRTSSPSGLSIGVPRHIGLSKGMSTLTRRNLAWSKAMALQSTSMTLPIPCPISLPASSFIKSKGRPYTYTHIGTIRNLTEKADILFPTDTEIRCNYLLMYIMLWALGPVRLLV